jgi:hypothetical protein
MQQLTPPYRGIPSVLRLRQLYWWRVVPWTWHLLRLSVLLAWEAPCTSTKDSTFWDGCLVCLHLRHVEHVVWPVITCVNSVNQEYGANALLVERNLPLCIKKMSAITIQVMMQLSLQQDFMQTQQSHCWTPNSCHCSKTSCKHSYHIAGLSH